MKKSLFVEVNNNNNAESIIKNLKEVKTATYQNRIEIDLFKKPKKKVIEDNFDPKSTKKSTFQINLDSVKFDVKLRSYSKKNEKALKTIDSFQTTKLDILISSSNSLCENNNKIDFQKKPIGSKISENTKKLISKVYEIDLVQLNSISTDQINKKSTIIKQANIESTKSLSGSTNIQRNYSFKMTDRDKDNANSTINSIVNSIKREQT